VDDEAAVRTSLAMILNEMGYEAQSVEGGFSALAELRHQLPDILVSDLKMPDMSGLELLSVVRRRFPVIRTIAMSGLLFEAAAWPGTAFKWSGIRCNPAAKNPPP
jgi:CheY-like chemotaxis protein